MPSELCETLGIEFPLFAFSHCRDVVVEVSRAGGMGVLGAVDVRSPEALEAELKWIDEHVDGKPYGVDFIVPNNYAGKGETLTSAQVAATVSAEHKAFARSILESHGVDTSDLTDERFSRGSKIGRNIRDEGAQSLLDIALSHPIRLIANALGTPPAYMLERSKAAGVPVAALVGSAKHALKQAAAGVDIIIAAGTEAGGHCGEIGTMVLVPTVIRALRAAGIKTPVLAAGGIVTGEQMAAAVAMGAAGAWTGSVWLTTPEAETSPAVKEKMLAATATDTIRSKSRTGKYCRQLRSAWTDAWETEGAPRPLPMPLQSVVSDTAMSKVLKLANGGHAGAKELASYFVGQGVGMMNVTMSTRATVRGFMEDYLTAVERLSTSVAS
ncbi:nitronate monooxygenase [Sphingomonas sp. CGMCC 1.13654]|uniref:Nitronate monooxygenase n=1 Tax=Sphingomonas chungangi TaxID=2683589 RepID=A0A838L9Q6_9SPHN|nr:nitronate monooxygenase [Sphingomonas chungangi]MVW56796.1 nitronate monooxygenase [Sphingomonas chungangi]